jgi:hypothetical protein
MTHPFRTCSALRALETCANLEAVFAAVTVAGQGLPRTMVIQPRSKTVMDNAAARFRRDFGMA